MKTSIRLKLLSLTLIGISIVTSGFGCKLTSSEERALLEPITLNWWGTFDDAENFSAIINDYKAIHPNISVNYRKLREEEFERELLNALAEDRGPDIVSLYNQDLQKWVPKLEPLPATTKLAYQRVQKSLNIKEEIITEIRETNSVTPAQVLQRFVDTVYQDVVVGNKIYGLPLSIDTLALLYNRDLFNNAALPLPPSTWADLQAFSRKLTFQDRTGALQQAGVALGTSNNIENFDDILSLLMMQNGAQMVSEGTVSFFAIPPGGTQEYIPGIEAIRFFTDFANPTKEVYSWNDGFQNSIDEFAQGRVAMIFAYQSQLEEIERKRQGKLNYGITTIPQIEGRNEVNIPRYQVQTVTKKSKNINEAWDFIQFMTTRQEQAQKYVDATNRPAALRTIVNEQLTDDSIAMFAQQILTAVNWYHGDNAPAMRQAFADMITNITQNSASVIDQARTAAQKIQQTY